VEILTLDEIYHDLTNWLSEQMFVLYTADCDGYITPPSSPHNTYDAGPVWRQWGVRSNHLVTMTTNGTVGAGCPLGAPKLWPSSTGWFFQMGYLAPVGLLEVPETLHCPGMNAFRQYGMDRVVWEGKTYKSYF